MNFFHRIFGKGKSSVLPVRRSPFAQLEIRKSEWLDVFSACLGKMYVVQYTVGETVIGDRDWTADFDRGIICFGKREYPVQLIGTESAVSNTWMWGWSNAPGFDERALVLADQSRRIGNEWELPPLTAETFELDETFNGHNLSIVTCGLSMENWCYYRCEHDAGAAFIAFSGIPDSVFAPISAEDFTDVAMRCIQQFELNHKIFVESLLLWNGNSYEWQDNNLCADSETTKLKIQVSDKWKQTIYQRNQASPVISAI